MGFYEKFVINLLRYDTNPPQGIYLGEFPPWRSKHGNMRSLIVYDGRETMSVNFQCMITMVMAIRQEKFQMIQTIKK